MSSWCQSVKMNESFAFQKPFLSDLPHCLRFVLHFLWGNCIKEVQNSTSWNCSYGMAPMNRKPPSVETIVHGTFKKRLHSVITQRRQQRRFQSDKPLTRSFACAIELCKWFTAQCWKKNTNQGNILGRWYTFEHVRSLSDHFQNDTVKITRPQSWQPGCFAS